MSRLPLLKVSDNRRFLVQADGTAFFWLGDTAWELFHRLNKEDALHYLQTRAEQGFNVVQAVALAEFEGVTTGNAYGRLPFKQNGEGEFDPGAPDLSEEQYDYWQHVDYIVKAAETKGIYIAMLPTWGDKFNKGQGKGPEIFNARNAKIYGQWLAERYKDSNNIIWVVGGDRRLETRRHFEVVHAMATGLREGDGGRHLITFHPAGGNSSSNHVHEETWLDFNMLQSGHGQRDKENYRMIARDYARQPVKPVLDGEPCYEDIPVGFKHENGYFDAADVRRAAYWGLFAGGFGHTYGHNSIWSMTDAAIDLFIMPWKQGLQRPGADQMKHARALMESRPMLERVPDQRLVAENEGGANYIAATRGDRYAFYYSPNGLRICARLGLIVGKRIFAQWYDPRMGTYSPIGVFDNSETRTFVPPSSGRGEDWVLVLDGEN